MLFVALAAIIVPLFLVVVLRLSARVGMGISAAAVAIGALVVWQMTPLALAASTLQGVHRAATILLILFGAMLLLKTLQQTGALMRIKFGLHTISADMRVQVVLVAFAFVSLLEGVSGFGTPAIVAAPLLVVLGFKPLAAASLALLGDTVAVTFGAVGTPLIVGLENTPSYSSALTWVVGAQVTAFDLIIGSLLPIGLVSLLVISFSDLSRRSKWHSIIEVLPWTLLVGFSYAITAFFTVRLIGPEFTAIIGGLVTLIVGTTTARINLWLPRQPWRHHADEDESEIATPDAYEHIPLWQAWLPYGVVIGLLLATRTIDSIKQVTLHAIDGSWQAILGVGEISSNWPILYSPGVILTIGAVVASLVIARSLQPLIQASKLSIDSLLGAAMALIPTLIMVQIFTNSGINSANFVAMPVFIGGALADMFGNVWAACAPLLGAIGAFIAGSSTVSTLTMAPVQASIAASSALPLIDVLALQMIGAAAGNTIAIHNVVAASTVVGLKHREGLIMRRLIVPTIVYIVIAAGIGFVALNLRLMPIIT